MVTSNVSCLQLRPKVLIKPPRYLPLSLSFSHVKPFCSVKMSQSVISNYLTRGAATRRPPITIAGPSNSSNKRDKGIDPEVSIIPNPPATISSPAPISDPV